MTRERWMALLFAIGSTCFLVGPFPGYAQLVGATAVGVTFFVGSIFFTAGGAMQSRLAFPARRSPGAGRAAWWTAIIQSAGTLFFNVTTFRSLATLATNAGYDRLVWRPDALGSICFLVSGAIAYRASPRNGWRPARSGSGWWEPGVNLLGCVFFGVSAIAGYVVPSTGSIVDLAAANWNTAAGAACFLACALATLRTGRTSKSPRFRRIRAIEHAVEDRVTHMRALGGVPRGAARAHPLAHLVGVRDARARKRAGDDHLGLDVDRRGPTRSLSFAANGSTASGTSAHRISVHRHSSALVLAPMRP